MTKIPNLNLPPLAIIPGVLEAREVTIDSDATHLYFRIHMVNGDVHAARLNLRNARKVCLQCSLPVLAKLLTLSLEKVKRSYPIVGEMVSINAAAYSANNAAHIAAMWSEHWKTVINPVLSCE